MHVYKTLSMPYPVRKIIFFMLVAVILSEIGLYWYFIGQAIYNTVALQKMDTKISTLSSNISELESVYITKTANITALEAEKLGFIEPRNVEFISARALGRGLAAKNDI